jgi:phospholipid transport system substrate-binding protein
MVKTEVVRTNDTVNVDYKLIKRSNEWQVYDLVVEGVSLVKNYRSQFGKIIHNESFDALMNKLNDKIKELETSDTVDESENKDNSVDNNDKI